MGYRFFFSYARETYAASKGFGRNYLDEFFDDLANQVALISGDRIEDVAFRDIDRLRISDNWEPALVAGMRDSAVLVAMVTPHYLKSLPCGREFELFRRRVLSADGTPNVQSHRIVPVYWIDHPQCHIQMRQPVREFLDTLQMTQRGLPAEYPRVGACDFYGLGDQAACYKFRRALAERIKELSELSQTTAAADMDTAFGHLPSFFDQEVGPVDLVRGPLGTNVIYAVATDTEIRPFGATLAPAYGTRREDWRPLSANHATTIERMTQRALTLAGQRDGQYASLGLPSDLIESMKKAYEANSPVLVVLDRTSLRIQGLQQRLSEYDTFDAAHVGLVTAGGTPADEALLGQIFPTKYLGKRPHHLWTVPASSDVYEQSVADVVSAVRTVVQKVSAATVSVPPSTMPGLTQPGER